MGAFHSAQVEENEEEEEGGEDGNEEQDDNDEKERGEFGDNSLVKKLLEQEPEMLPCHASASPLSPQLSSFGTPRLGPSIKVWDPYNVLAPPPPLSPPGPLAHNFSSDAVNHERKTLTEVLLISHGDWHMNLRPDLIAGRCPEAALTPNGKRQARALAVFLKSNGVRFSAVYTSPLDRARATAVSVCQEMDLVEEQIQSSDALVDISQGHWEGCRQSEIYTPEIMSLMDRFQPDFFAPSGESLRQVEFRMVEFLNGTVLRLPEKFRSPPSSQNESQEFSRHTLPDSSIHDRDVPPPPQWDFLHRQRQGGFSRKKSGKSRLQFVTTTRDHEADDEMSPREQPPIQNCVSEMNVRSSSSSSSSSSSIGVFTHAVPIKCLVTGLLGCSPAISHRICIEDSSVTVLQHSWKTGWQIKRLNDTAHLRLL